MEFMEFKEKMIAAVKKELGDGYEVSEHIVSKNNSVSLTGILARNEQSNIAPMIYLEPFYSAFFSGRTSFKNAVEDFLKAYRYSRFNGDFDTSSFTDYRKAKMRLKGKLVNTAMNRKLLPEVPHRDFLDLSIIYTVVFGDMEIGGLGSIVVNNSHMEAWGVTEQELYERAMENMEMSGDADISSISEVFDEMGEKLPEETGNAEVEMAVPMYIASNRSRLNGAVVMFSQAVLQKAAGILGKDFMILPSSIHELLFIPYSHEKGEEKKLVQMVREVNMTQLSSDEILSYHVYRYCSQTGNVEIVA